MAEALAGFGGAGRLMEQPPVRRVRRAGKRRLRKRWELYGFGLGALYFGFWWGMLGVGFRDYEVVRHVVNSEAATVSTAKLIVQNHALQSAQGRMDMAAFWGLVLPLIALVGVAVVRWVCCGLEVQRRARPDPGLPG